jgi:hypothetical protein
MNEIECPTCYQEVEVYRPAEDGPLYFKEHDDLDDDVCPMSNEPAPEED